MAFTYNISDNTDKVAYIRLRIQDNVEADAIFSDEDIERVVYEVGGNENDAIDELLTIRQIRVAADPDVVKAGDTQIETSVYSRLRALRTGQQQHRQAEGLYEGEAFVVVPIRSDV